MNAKWSQLEIERIRSLSLRWPSRYPTGQKVYCPACGKGYGWSGDKWTCNHLPCFPELHDKEVKAR